MKSKVSLRLFLLGCSALLAVPSAHAVDGTWTADDAFPDNNVTFVVDTVAEAPLNKITATIDSAAAAGGKLFGRLDASQP